MAFYPARGLPVFADPYPRYRDADFLGAVQTFAQHARPAPRDDDVLAVVEICHECSVATAQACRAPWIILRAPEDSAKVMGLPASTTFLARPVMAGEPERFRIWDLQDAGVTMSGDAILRDGSRLYGGKLEPDPLFQTAEWTQQDREFAQTLATSLGMTSFSVTNCTSLSELARRVEAEKLYALQEKLAKQLGVSGETIRQRLMRIGVHAPVKRAPRVKPE
jgi:hypothetical protein